MVGTVIDDRTLIFTLSVLGFGAVAARETWRVSERLENVMAPGAKLELAIWLLDFSAARQVKEWPRILMGIVDRIFGPHYWSWRCFLTAILQSAIVYWLTNILLIYTAPSLPLRLFSWMSIGWMVFTMFGGFFSTLVTRRSMTIMVSRSLVMQLLIIIFSLVFSWVILGAFFVIGVVVTYSVSKLWIGYIPIELWPDLVRTIAQRMAEFPYKILLMHAVIFRVQGGLPGEVPAEQVATQTVFFGALSTSLWLWAYFVAGLLARQVNRFDYRVQWLQKYFDIESKPLQSLGFLAGILVAVFLWTFGLTVGLAFGPRR